MRKIFIYCLILLIAIGSQPIPNLTSAESLESDGLYEVHIVDGLTSVPLYESNTNVEENQILVEIPDKSEIEILENIDEKEKDFWHIRYEYNDEEFVGFILNDNLEFKKVSIDEKDSTNDNNSAENEKESSNNAGNAENEKESSNNAGNDENEKEQTNETDKNSPDDKEQEYSKDHETKAYVDKEVDKKSTSKLGHIRSGNVSIYTEFGGDSFKAGNDYTNQVYYIKQEAIFNNTTYYLLSLQPSATKGIVGWVKAKDMFTHLHVGVDKKAKTFYINGKGKATTKAWGGSKDTVFSNSDLQKYTNQPFNVHLTETVEDDIWYRGTLNGQTVWLHESYLSDTQNIDKKATSKLGHIYSSDALIYNELGGTSSEAGSSRINQVYYIKQEANFGGQTFYLLSLDPSATNGVVGWIAEKDISTHSHVGVDKQAKTFYINGKGKATTKAWGGHKDVVFSNADLQDYVNYSFKVHLTEKVGNNTWYRGTLNNKTVWLHESYLSDTQNIKKQATSKLGHIRSGSVSIYNELGGTSIQAGNNYINKVYYIKQEAKLGSQTFYLLSLEPSATKGVVGWVAEKDMSTHPHVGVDKKAKTFYINGKGKATTKAWGGTKDTVFSNADLQKYINFPFKVHLTEKVSNNTWYRGTLNNKTVWLHESYVSNTQKIDKKATSKLGHIRTGGLIYKELGGPSINSGSTYTNQVYYIKQETNFNGQTFYLISLEPSATKGVVGWVAEKDMSTHPHVGVDKKAKTFYINGKGKATTKAWGGNKDVVFSNADLQKYVKQRFEVHLTEKVGNNTWYRGTLNGKTVWLHENHVSKGKGFITIDAGHGGKDPGAIGFGMSEKNITLDVAKKVERHLINEGYTTVMTREKDVFLELSEISNIANKAKTDLFVSIHVNSYNGSAHGIETYYYEKGPKPVESKRLATLLQNSMLSSTGAYNRGVKTQNFHVNRETNMPSSLVEIGFIDHFTESIKLKDNSYREKIAKSIVNGINKY